MGIAGRPLNYSCLGVVYLQARVLIGAPSTPLTPFTPIFPLSSCLSSPRHQQAWVNSSSCGPRLHVAMSYWIQWVCTTTNAQTRWKTRRFRTVNRLHPPTRPFAHTGLRKHTRVPIAYWWSKSKVKHTYPYAGGNLKPGGMQASRIEKQKKKLYGVWGRLPS